MIAHNHVSHIAVVIGAFSVSAFADRRMYSYRQSRLCMFEKLLFPFSPVNPISERQHASRAIESILTDNETSPKPKSPESLTQPTTSPGSTRHEKQHDIETSYRNHGSENKKASAREPRVTSQLHSPPTPLKRRGPR